jgi:EAL domain-containing protein (putative c-di-GMP-specific phosphodiesterase class I)
MLMQSKSFFKKTLANNIMPGLESGEFMVYYQPKMDLVSRKIVSLEALARWSSSGIGWVSPSEFIPVAESTGKIVALGEWILFSACQQTKIWQKNGLQKLSVSVNMSPRQLEEKNIVSRVEGILAQTGLDPQFLELEITESVFIKNSLKALQVLNKIRSLGVRLAIDDFGTGYSSIGYLTAFPFDSLKIDQVFARSIHIPQTQIVIRAMTQLSRQLGLKTVIEGIEDETELVVAGHLGCDQAQGYAIEHPLPADKVLFALSRFQKERGPKR